MTQEPNAQNPYYAAPKQPITANEERTVGMLAHLIPIIAMVLSGGLLGFVGSLIVYLMYKDRGPFVRRNAANSLNIQITMGIVLLVSLPLMFVLIGFVTFAAAFVVALVLHIIGAVRANAGDWWDPPITINFVKG